MPQFENEYADKPSGARPIPGIIQQQLASFLEVWLRIAGITLYEHEHEGLANFLGAILRAYPKIQDFWKQPDPSP